MTRVARRRKKGPLAREGDVVVLPLREGGYAVGVIARAPGQGACLGYFFGPKLLESPTVVDCSKLRSQDAIYVARFGDLGILEGEWPIVGRVEPWSREEWPLPEFQADQRIIVTYDDDSLEETWRKIATPAECAGLPDDGMNGAGYVEKKLTRLIG